MLGNVLVVNGVDLQCSFPSAKKFAFIFENAHLMLLTWERDDTKLLFLIKEQSDGKVVLDFPGRTFVDRVMDMIDKFFFIQVQSDDGVANRYVLGSYFYIGNKRYGAFYERDVETNPDVVLFRIDGDGDEVVISVLEEEEFADVAENFREMHGDFLQIHK